MPNPCFQQLACTETGTGYTCAACVDAGCPVLRAQAGPDVTILPGSPTLLTGSATGANGGFGCQWTEDADGGVVASTCAAMVSPLAETAYTLTVTDASGATASDTMVVRIASLLASAGPDSNVLQGQPATLTASWTGASCVDASCITCAWRLSDGGTVASTCTTQVSPIATTQYFLQVSDVNAGTSATDSATVFVTDRPAQLCGWNVVVLTSNEYPTSANPNFLCDSTGTARRQTVNGKPAIVLSDLRVSNVRIVGNISVETSSDDDHIGFLWGWQSPKEAYLLTWKQLAQNWTAACGNAPRGIAVKKLDGARAGPTTISFNPSFGFNATDYVYSCADLWSQSRANDGLLKDGTVFLSTPQDPGGVTAGWTDFITYRFEFFYTPARTRVLVYEDDLGTGSTTSLVASLLVEDSSFPAGAFAFFSNSQEQVAFGDFTLASLDGYRADAGPDQAIGPGQAAMLAGSAVLAVPPYGCEWSAGDAGVSSTCSATVSPGQSTTYTLTVTDDFGRQATDEVTVSVSP